jgi:L-fuculose-phosphate aldolase
LIKLKPGLGIRDARLEKGLENCDLCGNSLFREGYSDFKPEPRAFIPPKLQQVVDQVAAASSGAAPSPNGDNVESLVQKMTDQVMSAMNGKA